MAALHGMASAAAVAADTLQADAFKRLYPEQYFERFVAEGIRPDGRTLSVCRPASIGMHSVAQADGSALVKVGSTTVLAGARLEVMVPPAARPDVGQVVVSVEMTPLATPDWRPGRRSEAADVMAATISGIITGDARGDGLSTGNWAPQAPSGAAQRGVVDLKQLCIAAGQAVWVLYLDLYVLDADGSLLDAGLLAAAAALHDVRLPAVELTEEGNVERMPADGDVDMNGASGSGQPLALAFTPYCLTCGLYRQHILADPAAEEEALLGGSVSVLMDQEGSLLGVLKAGGSSTATPQVLKRCMELAAARTQELHQYLQLQLDAAGGQR